MPLALNRSDPTEHPGLNHRRRLPIDRVGSSLQTDLKHRAPSLNQSRQFLSLLDGVYLTRYTLILTRSVSEDATHVLAYDSG